MCLPSPDSSASRRAGRKTVRWTRINLKSGRPRLIGGARLRYISRIPASEWRRILPAHFHETSLPLLLAGTSCVALTCPQLIADAHAARETTPRPKKRSKTFNPPRRRRFFATARAAFPAEPAANLQALPLIAFCCYEVPRPVGPPNRQMYKGARKCAISTPCCACAISMPR
jgi:hypothetical protein